MADMTSPATTALIAYQDLENELRKEGLWIVLESLVQEVRDTTYEWGLDDGWEDCRRLKEDRKRLKEGQ